MKKTVIGMAMMAMALVGFNGMAQNTTESSKAQVENKGCCKQGDKSKKEGKKQAREMKNPYDGLNITDAQKSKLAELDAKQQAKRQAKMEAMKAQKDANKAEKKSMTDAEKQAAKKAQMEARRAEKIEYLQEVKEIVGPDQYVVFLENMYVNAGQPGGGKAIKQGQKFDKQGSKKGMAHAKGDRKNDRKGDRKGSQRGQNAQRS